jgi:hypothetical protein
MTPLGQYFGISASSGRTFDPASISGLVAWWKADAGVYQLSTLATPAVADGDPVGGVQDNSGSGNPQLQANTSLRGTLKLNIQNGRSVIRFAAGGQYLKSIFTLTQPCTLVLVFRTGTTSSNNYFSGGATAPDIEILRYGNAIKIYAGVYGSKLTVSDATIDILTVVLNGTSSKYRVNRCAYVTENLGTNAPGGLTIGAWANGSSSIAMDFCEGLIYSGTVSDANLDLLLSYLNTRWAIFDPSSLSPVFESLPITGTWDYEKPYFTILKFGSADYRMWYGCADVPQDINSAYATSTDGNTWTRPVLHQVTYGANNNNNLIYVAGDYIVACVYNAVGATGQKFLLLASSSSGTTGIQILGSDDGVTSWSIVKTVYTSGTPFKEGHGLALRSDGRYAAFYSYGHSSDLRSIGMFTSDTTDPTGTWTDQGPCTGLTASLSTAQFYGLSITQYGGNWYGFVNRYNSTTGTGDMDLWSSSDNGATWTQLAANWIPRGSDGDWDSRFLSCAQALQVGSEWRIYYSGGSNPHSAATMPQQIGYKLATTLSPNPFV